MTDIDVRLREDVHVLGELLGETIRQQHGDAFLQKIEAIRHSAKADRRGAAEQLSSTLDDLADDELLPVARASVRVSQAATFPAAPPPCVEI